MPSTYTLNNGIELIATGEQSGTWGDTTNTNLELLDTSLDGQVTVTLASTGSSGSPNTLPVSDGAASNGRNRLVIFDDSSDLGGTAFVQLTPSDAEKIIYVRNSLSGSRSILLFQGTYNASNDYEVPAGTTAIVFFNGAGAGAVAANVFNNAHFDVLNVVGGGAFGGAVTVSTGDSGATAASNADDLVVEASGDGGISILNPASNTGTLFFGDPSGSNMGQIKYSHTDDAMSIVTAQNTAITIDSSRRVLIGDTSSQAVYEDGSAINSTLQINNSEGSAMIARTIGSGRLFLARNQSVVLNSPLGEVSFNGGDGTNLRQAAKIIASVDGGPATGDMPGRLQFYTTADGAASPTERMRLHSNGDLSMGTTSNSYGDFSILRSGTNNTKIGIANAGNGGGTVNWSLEHDYSNYDFTISHNAGVGGQNLIFGTKTSGGESARIDSGGRLLIGYTANTSVADHNAALQVVGQGTADYHGATTSIIGFSNNSNGAYLNFASGRSNTAGTYTIVANDDTVGQINFAAADGTDMASRAAFINVNIDGAPGANDTPGRIIFGTTADGSSSPTERMRITSAGLIGLNSTSPTQEVSIGGNIDFQSTSGSNATMRRIAWRNTNSSGYEVANIQGYTGGNIYEGQIAFQTKDSGGTMTEAMRIDSSQRVLIGSLGSAETTISGGAPNFQVTGAVFDSYGSFTRRQNTQYGAGIVIAKSRNSSANSYTIVQDDDVLGSVIFIGDDGTDLDTYGATIAAEVDGTPGANDMPARLVFKTTADGASSPTERMRITNGGHVLVGTTTTSGFQTSSSLTGTIAYAEGAIASTVSGDAPLYLNRLTSNGIILNLRKNGTTIGGISIKSRNSLVRPYIGNSNTRLLFDNGIDSIIPVNNDGDDRNAAISLGEAGAAFKDLYLTGGIQFDSRSNKLDDYEEGTWTPSFVATTTDPTISYDQRFGRYTKIGNTVYVYLYIKVLTASGGSGNMNISGLPYNNSSNVPISEGNSFQFNYIVNTNISTGRVLAGYFRNNDDKIYCVVQGAGNTAGYSVSDFTTNNNLTVYGSGMYTVSS